MESETLSQYVTLRIRAGVAKAEVKEELVAIGWTEDEAEAAFRDGVIALGAPTPSADRRGAVAKKAATVDVVINFFSFILLGIVATALGTLYFQLVNLQFPDALNVDQWYSRPQAVSSIHYSIAALLIGFPLYYFSMRLWFRAFRADEGRMESKLSKWLTYLVLLIAAVTIVGDLIAVVFTLLQGEITTRFFLKALTILAIAGAIFGFYYLERRKVQYLVDVPRATFQYFGRGVTLVSLVGVVLGFIVGGSPMTERSRSFDQTRAENLSSLASCVEQYASNLGALPVSLDELIRASQYSYCESYMNDPETLQSYEYRVVVPTRVQGAARVGDFELCADFSFATDETAEMQGVTYGVSGTWSKHGVGRSCDTVSAQLMVPTPNPILTPSPTGVGF